MGQMFNARAPRHHDDNDAPSTLLMAGFWAYGDDDDAYDLRRQLRWGFSPFARHLVIEFTTSLFSLVISDCRSHARAQRRKRRNSTASLFGRRGGSNTLRIKEYFQRAPWRPSGRPLSAELDFGLFFGAFWTSKIVRI